MRFSIATVSISGTLERKIDAIAEAGFSGIEIFENDLLASVSTPAEIKARLADKGLRIETYQPFRDFESMVEPLRSRTFDRAEHKFDLMEEIGAELLMVCSNVSPHAQGGIGRAADDFHELGERAAKRGFRVAFEALGWGRYVHDYRDSWEVVRRADHPAVGLCLDTFHIFSRATELDSILNIPGDRIFLVQVADAPKLSMDPLSWSRHHRCFPGQGELDLRQFMTNLNETGYDGALSLEIFNDQFRSSDTFRHAKDAYRSLIWLDGGTPPAPPSPSEKLEEVNQPAEIEFIEFAVDENEHQSLATFLHAGGFVHAATHKVKRVELWRQGKINLVINLESQSFAQRYHSEHGLSVCAYGFLCTDADALVKRATTLGYEVVYADPEHDTHGIAAIVGPTGTLLYLVNADDYPTHWEREFDHHTDYRHDLLSRVDHVATTMPLDEVLEAKLLYRAVFRMAASQAVTVADPLGNVNSQVMEVDDKAIAMTLNSTLAGKSSVAQIQSRYRGSGVNHIALTCSDIFALADRIGELGTDIMEVTENYYDDLIARFGLPEELVERMKARHILYDEDEEGAFFQLFTRLFQGRFCFEFVQRDGYGGYGMANAQIRLTMQARELDDLAAGST